MKLKFHKKKNTFVFTWWCT